MTKVSIPNLTFCDRNGNIPRAKFLPSSPTVHEAAQSAAREMGLTDTQRRNRAIIDSSIAIGTVSGRALRALTDTYTKYATRVTKVSDKPNIHGRPIYTAVHIGKYKSSADELRRKNVRTFMASKLLVDSDCISVYGLEPTLIQQATFNPSHNYRPFDMTIDLQALRDYAALVALDDTVELFVHYGQQALSLVEPNSRMTFYHISLEPE